jgi:hypothetical protein
MTAQPDNRLPGEGACRRDVFRMRMRVKPPMIAVLFFSACRMRHAEDRRRLRQHSGVLHLPFPGGGRGDAAPFPFRCSAGGDAHPRSDPGRDPDANSLPLKQGCGPRGGGRPGNRVRGDRRGQGEVLGEQRTRPVGGWNPGEQEPAGRSERPGVCGSDCGRVGAHLCVDEYRGSEMLGVQQEWGTGQQEKRR